jgi:hypothetical protein
MTYVELRDQYLNDPSAKNFLKDLVRTLDAKDPVKLLGELKHVYEIFNVRSCEALGVEYSCNDN